VLSQQLQGQLQTQHSGDKVFSIKCFLLEYFNSSSPKDLRISFNTITGNTSVSTATGHGAGLPRFDSWQQNFFYTPQHPDRLWGSPSLLTNGYRDSFPMAKAARREDEPLPLSTTEVNIGGATPSYIFMA
jgi:hypothetical protein